MLLIFLVKQKCMLTGVINFRALIGLSKQNNEAIYCADKMFVLDRGFFLKRDPQT